VISCHTVGPPSGVRPLVAVCEHLAAVSGIEEHERGGAERILKNGNGESRGTGGVVADGLAGRLDELRSPVADVVARNLALLAIRDVPDSLVGDSIRDAELVGAALSAARGCRWRGRPRSGRPEPSALM
jgi:hypothetical protein